MHIQLQSGKSYEQLAPVTFAKTPPEKPEFWATSTEQAIRRAFDRLLACHGPLHPNRRYSPIDFGWGDAGVGNIAVYEKIGEIRCETDRLKATWTISFGFCARQVSTIRIVANINDTDEAADIAVEATK